MTKRKCCVALATAAMLLLTAAVATAAPVASPGKDPEQILDMNYSPAKKSTKQKPTGLALSFDVQTNAPDGGPPPLATSAEILLAKGITFNTKQFPTCVEANLQQKMPDKCAKAKIGSGKAVATAFNPADRTKVIAKRNCANLTIYNGPGGKIYFYLVTKAGDPADAALNCTEPFVANTTILTGTLQGASAPYGKKLSIPLVVPDPIPGAKIGLDRVQAKVSASVKVKNKKTKKMVKVPFLAAPTTCTKAGWAFGYTSLGYPAGPLTTAGATPCK